MESMNNLTDPISTAICLLRIYEALGSIPEPLKTKRVKNSCDQAWWLMLLILIFGNRHKKIKNSRTFSVTLKI